MGGCRELGAGVCRLATPPAPCTRAPPRMRCRIERLLTPHSASCGCVECRTVLVVPPSCHMLRWCPRRDGAACAEFSPRAPHKPPCSV
eukprot:233870-Chlamydomonas_euryale.AAC.1